MKKSVYSIVLMDDIITAVDREAYRLGTSRSNLINQILAEHLSCITPEMRMREIYNSISSIMNTHFQIQQQYADSLMTLKTALEYKYRPTVNYKVAISRSPDRFLGTLKVHIRTQSPSLINMFDSFFVYWIKLEREFFRRIGVDCYSCELSSGNFIRPLINAGKLSEAEIGEAICSYINLLDKFIKLYFAAPQSFNSTALMLEAEYAALLQHTII